MNSMFGGSPPVTQGMFGGGQTQGMMGDPHLLQLIQRLLMAGGPAATPQAMPQMGQLSPQMIQQLMMNQRGMY